MLRRLSRSLIPIVHGKTRPKIVMFSTIVKQDQQPSSNYAKISNNLAVYKWKWIAGSGLLVLSLIAFGPEIKGGFSKHTADVASQSLRNENLQIQTQELAADIVKTVLNDPKVLDQASQFLQRLVQMQGTQDALLNLTKYTLNDPQTLHQVTKLSKQLLYNLMQDPTTLKQLVELLKMSILDPSTKESLVFLVNELMKDEETRNQISALLSWAFIQPQVLESVHSNLSDNVHAILSSQDIQNHTKEFVGEVVRDRTVQNESGDALWGTFWYTVTPRWISWLWRSTPSVEDVECLEQLPVEYSHVENSEETKEKLYREHESDHLDDEFNHVPQKESRTNVPQLQEYEDLEAWEKNFLSS